MKKELLRKTLQGIDVFHDKAAEVMYVRLRKHAYDHGINLDSERRVDYDAHGKATGILVLHSRRDGVNLDNVPHPRLITRLLRDRGIAVFRAGQEQE
jgi:uncharacterized protein YuzE